MLFALAATLLSVVLGLAFLARRRRPAQARAADATSPRQPAVSIHFGSETGTAEGFARELCRAARARGLRAEASNLSVWRSGVLGQPCVTEPPDLVIILVATHGDGAPPADAADFCAALRAGEVELHAPFCVFGLGHTAYQHFNAVARRVDRRLARSGRATRALPLALGDDAGNLRADFGAWCAALWAQLGVPASVHAAAGESGGDDAAEGAFELVYVPLRPGETPPAPVPASLGTTRLDRTEQTRALVLSTARADTAGLLLAPCGGAARGAAEGAAAGASVSAAPPASTFEPPRSERLLVRLRVPVALARSLDVGDHIGLHAHGGPVTAVQLATRLRLRLSAVAELRARITPPGPAAAAAERAAAAHEYRFPCPCSVRTMLCEWLDAHAPPPPETLAVLARSCGAEGEEAQGGGAASAQAQRGRLLELAKGGEAYRAWSGSEGATLLGALTEFPAARPDAGGLLGSLPRLQPRFFSLACDPRLAVERALGAHAEGAERAEPDAEGPTAVLALLATLQRRPGGALGVCSAHLARAKPGRDSVWVSGHASAFKPPPSMATPMLCVAAGSGLAPFLGFFERREAALASAAVSAADAGACALGRALLYLGCRTRGEIPLRAQLDAWAASGEGGVLSRVEYALSREVPRTGPAYVQHALARDAAAVHKLVGAEGAHVYVCGSGALAHAVRAELVRILAEHGGTSTEAAEERMARMQKSGQYQQDVWG